MSKRLVIMPRNCTGCRSCEESCALAKADEGVPGRSRIEVTEVGQDRYVQMTCFQCMNAACVAVCPSGALVRNEETRAIEVSIAGCIGCGLCAAACPFGHMAFGRELGLPLKCDLCGGDPVCARVCPHGALEIRD